MKKIKAIAVLMAMTLTFSMFATAASAANVQMVSNSASAVSANLTSYGYEDFVKNLENAKYAALFDFDGILQTGSSLPYVTKGNGSTLESSIVGGTENEKCVLTLTEGSVNIWDEEIVTAADSKLNQTFASGKDCMTINAGSSVTISVGENDALKPVEIGYIVSLHRGNVGTKIANNVTVTLSSITEPSVTTTEPVQMWSSTSRNGLLRFYGYKAPVGKYIKSVTISNADGATHLRVDDLCVVYKEASNVGIRYSKDESGFVEYTSLSQIEEGNGYITISPEWATGKKLIVAMYAGNSLYAVEPIAEDTASKTFQMWEGRKNRLSSIKIFVLDKATLVPACVNATIE